MLAGVAVVVPCYRVRRHIMGVLAGLRGRVAAVYVVDDACTEGTGRFVQAWCDDPGVTVLFHAENQGVGGAVMTGYARALVDRHAVVVKMDGDGQMDPAFLDALVAPVLSGAADYAKGNRFCGWRSVRAMPGLRVAGNLAASVLMRVASRWRGMDPCNGYTAIARERLLRLPFDRLERRWFFESDMLCWLSGVGAVVQDVPIPARYGDEASGMNAALVLREFPLRLTARAMRRIWGGWGEGRRGRGFRRAAPPGAPSPCPPCW
jgi:glycosyltransferase involved in cell wall biosynthesis